VVFYACGPNFKQNYRHPVIHSTDVYPLLARLLGVIPASCDGDLDRVKGMLR
jgi:hypothetical protein